MMEYQEKFGKNEKKRKKELHVFISKIVIDEWVGQRKLKRRRRRRKWFLLWLWVVSYICLSLMVSVILFISEKKITKRNDLKEKMIRCWFSHLSISKNCKKKRKEKERTNRYLYRNLNSILSSSASEYDIVQAIAVCLCVKSYINEILSILILFHCNCKSIESFWMPFHWCSRGICKSWKQSWSRIATMLLIDQRNAANTQIQTHLTSSTNWNEWTFRDSSLREQQLW